MRDGLVVGGLMSVHSHFLSVLKLIALVTITSVTYKMYTSFFLVRVCVCVCERVYNVYIEHNFLSFALGPMECYERQMSFADSV